MTRRVGVLGGTFDPIHVGHLDALDAARAALALDATLVIPSHHPPHRPNAPRVTPFHRFAMAALALDGRPGARVSDLELTRPGPSYTIDTLRALHDQGWRPWQIFFIIGTDAFADIASWRAFPEVLDAAHFAVIARPGTTLDAAIRRTPSLESRAVADPAAVPAAPATCVVRIEARTRDVASTAVRARIAEGRSIDALVPPAVARYVAVNNLYGAVDDLHGEDTGRT
jgi:nicotinate-nucleotide adenylyltransferase